MLMHLFWRQTCAGMTQRSCCIYVFELGCSGVGGPYCFGVPLRFQNPNLKTSARQALGLKRLLPWAGRQELRGTIARYTGAAQMCASLTKYIPIVCGPYVCTSFSVRLPSRLDKRSSRCSGIAVLAGGDACRYMKEFRCLEIPDECAVPNRQEFFKLTTASSSDALVPPNWCYVDLDFTHFQSSADHKQQATRPPVPARTSHVAFKLMCSVVVPGPVAVVLHLASGIAGRTWACRKCGTITV